MTTYARGMSAALVVLGPMPRGQVAAMLCGLEITEHDAEAVIAHGIAERILIESVVGVATGPAVE